MTYWVWAIGRLRRQLWWRAMIFGLLGVGTAVFATIAERFIPWDLPLNLSPSAVESLLNIIASSMLAVTTFSLGAMTAAFGAATSNVTPRATKLLMEDRITHNVLSTFIGAFLFSIVGIIVLKTGSYGERGRAVLFVITIVVIGVIVAQLFRWINHLIKLGRVGTTTELVEQAAADAIAERLKVPYLGGHPWKEDEEIPSQAKAIGAEKTGYLQFINVQKLAEICEEMEVDVWIPSNPGKFLYENSAVCWVSGNADLFEEIENSVRDCFIIEGSRSFEQDPRFGLAVLAEVGSRALSPATNDPGTALDVIGRVTRLLAQWAEGRADVEVDFTRLHVRPISDQDLLEDAFMLLARDGAGLIEIQLRLQKSFAFLMSRGSESFRNAVGMQAKMALERAQSAMTYSGDIKRLHDETAELTSSPLF